MSGRTHSVARSVLAGLLVLFLSLCLFFHILERRQKAHEVNIRLELSIEHLIPEVCEALEGEEMLLLDGRFPLRISSSTSTPSLLRFYDATKECEFTVPSKKYSDYKIVLETTAREHPFGYAVGGVRTVNVGMGLTLLGQRCKIYGTLSSLEVLLAE